MSSAADFRGFYSGSGGDSAKGGARDSGGHITMVAEAGTAHQGSLDAARKLIDAARWAGADAIKFQAVIAEEIVHPKVGSIELPGGSTDIYARFQSLEQAPEFYRSLKEESERAGLRFLCSPFGPRSAGILLDLGVEWVKIASPELNYYRLLSQVCGKPLVLSTGVSTLADIEEAIAFLRLPDRPTPPVCLLHCVTSYPAPEEEYNLRIIPLLAGLFGVPVGLSDHSRDPVLVPVLGAAAGAVMIEKHLTLSAETDGLDDPIALTPEEFGRMVKAVRSCEAAVARNSGPGRYGAGGGCDGAEEPGLDCGAGGFGWGGGGRNSGFGEGVAARILVEEHGYAPDLIETVLGDGRKRLAPSEAPWYGGTNRSLVALEDLEEGTRLGEDNTALLRCEQGHRPGLAPRYYPTVMGSRIIRPVKAGEGITWPHLLR